MYFQFNLEKSDDEDSSVLLLEEEDLFSVLDEEISVLEESPLLEEEDLNSFSNEDEYVGIIGLSSDVPGLPQAPNSPATTQHNKNLRMLNTFFCCIS